MATSGEIPQIVPDVKNESKTEEPSAVSAIVEKLNVNEFSFVIDGLTPFDMVRTPRKLVDNNQSSKLLAEALNGELKCPICLGLLDNPTAIMECMHRFCEDCISKSIRVTKKECPACRTKCASKRSTRQDPVFKAFIQRMYPHREDYEKDKANPVAIRVPQYQPPQRKKPGPKPGQRNRRPTSEESSESSGDGAESADDNTGAVPRKRKAAKLEDASQANGATGKATAPRGVGRKKGSVDVDLVMLVHPQSQAPGLDKPFLRTNSTVTIAHLAKYLAIKTNRRADWYSFFVEDHRLDPEWALSDVLHNYWSDSMDTLVIHYKMEDRDK